MQFIIINIIVDTIKKSYKMDELIFTNQVDEYVHAHPDSRLLILPYQLKYEKMLESLLISWNHYKYLPIDEFNKKASRSVFEHVLKQAKQTDDNPIAIFKRLSIQDQLNIYRAF